MEQPVPISDRHQAQASARPASAHDERSRFHPSHGGVVPLRHAIRRELHAERLEQVPQSRERRRASGHVDQLIAAAASVVWVAGFVQSIVDEITGEEPQD